MTKLRPPLTFELALTRIAGVLGWSSVSEICNQQDRTVRNWSDPDTSAFGLTVKMGVELDLAYQEAGGTGAPMHECYANLLKVGLALSMTDFERLTESVAIGARESGEATAAAIAASHPNATLVDITIGERETEEAIAAHTDTLSHLRSRRQALEAANG